MVCGTISAALTCMVIDDRSESIFRCSSERRSRLIMSNDAKNNNIKKKKTQTLPMLALRGLVVFPGAVVHFDVARPKSNAALKAALENGKLIYLAAQMDMDVEEPENDDIYGVGVVAEIRQILKTPDDVTRVLVEGLYRAKTVKTDNSGEYLTAEIKRFPEKNLKADPVEIDAVMRAVKDAFEQYAALLPRMPREIYDSVLNENDPQELFESLAFNIALAVEDKQDLLEESSVELRLGMLLSMLSRETEIMTMERALQEKVKGQIDNSQKEYYLREQLKVIQEQLGELSGDPTMAGPMGEYDEEDDYTDRITALGLPEETEAKLLKENERLLKMPPVSQDAAVLRTYLDTVLDLPWNTSTEDNNDIVNARAVLDADHFGLEKVKDRIIENIAVRALSPDIKGQIICLAGPPGVGKTSVGKSIAEALGRKYVRVSLGGVRDEADIRGHRKTYVGAMPGRIIAAIKQAGVNNPLIMLDEIDKLTHDMRGDPSAALLEVLDSEQNYAFRDHYIEVPFDLSNVLFITTANNVSEIDAPLLDRMEVIELSSYTREEKFRIAKDHLIPKQIKKHGLKASNMKIADNAIYILIDSYTREAGVRKLERMIASLCRKAAKQIVAGEKTKVSVTSRNIEEYLGHKKYLGDEISKKDEVGLVNGLAWTSVGGVMLPMEVLVMDGKGVIETTGSLGNVMKESAKIAVSYVRSVCGKYGIESDFYKKKDIHIHAPEGATPKDGPSAGVTMTTALVSALSGIPVRHDVAMTGEITLHGKVLPIGGLREKTMAAYKEGMKTVIIPKGNAGDLDDVDETVKENVNFVLAETLTDVLNTALTKGRSMKSPKPMKNTPAPAAPVPSSDSSGGTEDQADAIRS